jgi:mannan endo-1,4-beta-mannosidase
MNLKSTNICLLIGLLILTYKAVQGSENAIVPVTPNASSEATELLNLFYEISGKFILTGQHCAPLVGSTRLSVVHRRIKKYPALFGQDFGFSYPGYWDGINYRQRTVDEAILRHHDRVVNRNFRVYFFKGILIISIINNFKSFRDDKI